MVNHLTSINAQFLPGTATYVTHYQRIVDWYCWFQFEFSHFQCLYCSFIIVCQRSICHTMVQEHEYMYFKLTTRNIL